MLVCDLCDGVVSDGDEFEHIKRWHLVMYNEAMQELVDFHFYEWDGSDPRDDVPTAWELNEGGV